MAKENTYFFVTPVGQIYDDVIKQRLTAFKTKDDALKVAKIEFPENSKFTLHKVTFTELDTYQKIVKTEVVPPTP